MNDDWKCPDCSAPLLRQGRELNCPTCVRVWTEQTLCPQCESELELLKACGAIDYFCPQCKVLQSKRTLLRRLQPA